MQCPVRMASQAGDANARLAAVSIDSEADAPSATTASARPAILRSTAFSKTSGAPAQPTAVANAIKVLGASLPSASPASSAAASKLIPIQILPSAAISSSLPRIISNGTKVNAACAPNGGLLVANLHGQSSATASAILQTTAASSRGPTLAVVRKLVAISPRSPSSAAPCPTAAVAAMVKPAHATASLPNILRSSSAVSSSASPKSVALFSSSASEWKSNGKEERLETDLAEAESAAVPHEVNDEIEGTTDGSEGNGVNEREVLPQAEHHQAGVDVDALLLPLEDTDAISQDTKDSLDKLKLRVNDLGAIELDEDLATNESLAEDDDDIDLTCKEETPLSPKLKEASPPSAAPPSAAPKHRDTDILCCKGCGCYGMAGEFHDHESCSAECKRRIKEKIREREKKERELLVQKARREAKKKEKQLEKEASFQAAAVGSGRQGQRSKCENEATPASGYEPSSERTENCGPDSESHSAQLERIVEQAGLQRGNRKRKRPKFFDEDTSSARSVSPPAPLAKATDRPWELSKEAEIRLSVFRPPEAVSFGETSVLDRRPIGWRRNCAFLQPLVKGLTRGAVMRWTATDVAALVMSLPSLDPGVAEKLVEQEVDGESFLLLTQGDLNSLGVKLGQALKLINAIHLIKSNA